MEIDVRILSGGAYEVCILLTPEDLILARLSKDYVPPAAWEKDESLIIALMKHGVIK